MADIEKLAGEFGDFVGNGDFEGAFNLVKSNPVEFDKKLQSACIGESLKKSTTDRVVLSYIDSAGFGTRELGDSLHRLEKLLRITPGVLVLAKVWGLGEVKKVDYFYRRITVDFKQKRGHQYAYDVAAETLEFPGENHVLVLEKIDPVRISNLLKESPAGFVKLVLESYGSMPLLKLEKTVVENGFVKKEAWKAFWDKARTELKRDKCVEIPVKKTDPISVRKAAEEYGESWLTAFGHETEPNRILASVREFVASEKYSGEESVKDRITDRLVFALTAASKTDDALYARLANLVTELGLQRPPVAEMREYLWSRHRYLKAATALPAREVGALIRFLAFDAASRDKLFAAIPEFNFVAVSEIVSQFADDEALRSAVGAFLKQAKAPATLVTLVAGRYEQFREWGQMPSLLVVLMHAIALGEGRQGGETLRMQNMVRRLFSDIKWLEKMFAELDDGEKALLFERFQASIAWDHSSHHATVIRMTKLVPALAAHLVQTGQKKSEPRRTSFRSYAMKKAEYQKLINKDMPENVKRIEFAKGFGDLSENAEYQYAKDEQRQLMQKQSVMQDELNQVKPDGFSVSSLDEIVPGTTVTLDVGGEKKTYSILGEWDNDPDAGIISSKTRLALSLVGHKAGDSVMIPGADGNDVPATVLSIDALSDEVRRWMEVPEGMNI